MPPLAVIVCPGDTDKLPLMTPSAVLLDAPAGSVV